MFQNLIRGTRADCSARHAIVRARDSLSVSVAPRLDRSRRQLLIGALGSMAAAAHGAPMSSALKGPCKVAFVYVSPVGDAGWTYEHDVARRQMEAALGDRVQTSVVASVPEGPDAERVFRSLCDDGVQLIFATSFGYLEPALRVAADFPNVRFEHAGGYKTAPNLGTYNARYYEARYLAGLLAARTTRSGTVGYVAGFPVPEVVQGINAFATGLRSIAHDAVVRPIFVDSWFDPAREREAALTLVNQGADVLTHHSGSTAVAQLAEERKVRVVTYQSDMRRVAPHAQLAAVASPWGDFYTRTVRSVLDGTWTSQPVWGGMKDGMVELAAIDPSLPADVRQMLDKARADIVAGRLAPFGRPLSDAEIERMDRFAPGVVGARPGAPAAPRP